MKLYEGLFLFDANLATKDWPGLEKHVGDLLKKNEADLVYSERWPDRKLSYEVKGCRKGTYFLTYFNAPGETIPALHRDVQLSERVLRLMVLQNEYIEEVLEKHQNRQAERDAAAAEKKAAAEGEAQETSPEKVKATEESEVSKAEENAPGEATESASGNGAEAPATENPDDTVSQKEEAPEEAAPEDAPEEAAPEDAPEEAAPEETPEEAAPEETPEEAAPEDAPEEAAPQEAADTPTEESSEDSSAATNDEEENEQS